MFFMLGKLKYRASEHKAKLVYALSSAADIHEIKVPASTPNMRYAGMNNI